MQDTKMTYLSHKVHTQGMQGICKCATVFLVHDLPFIFFLNNCLFKKAAYKTLANINSKKYIYILNFEYLRFFYFIDTIFEFIFYFISAAQDTLYRLCLIILAIYTFATAKGITR